MEANERKRLEYLARIKDVAVDNLVYIDESGIDMNICKDRGWGKKGQLLCAQKSGKYYERTNIIAGLINNKAIAPVVFNGSCNREFFERWVEQFLIKDLQVGQIVIMDNAAFHKSEKVIKLVESVGCSILFLPPYSPDLNPIEKFWANMKRWIKQKIDLFEDLYTSLGNFFSIP